MTGQEGRTYERFRDSVRSNYQVSREFVRPHSEDTELLNLKDILVKRGPDSALVHSALRFHGRMRGCSVKFTDQVIRLVRGKCELRLNREQFVQVPWMIAWYDFYFKTIESVNDGGWRILDFSKPGVHRYVRSGIAFSFPSIPEDDVIDAYVHQYRPRRGDVVWDVGAHAGATTYALAKMVGQSGRVYAFEPDGLNFEYLKANVGAHRLDNVFLVPKALSESVGTASFNMDGTMSAGLSGFLIYKDRKHSRSVATIGIQDACSEFGQVPNFIKMDIEGAEAAAIEAAKGFLKQHAIHFAIESNHRVKGELTWRSLEQTFLAIGYSVHSSAQFGEMITWAGPHK